MEQLISLYKKVSSIASTLLLFLSLFLSIDLVNDSLDTSLGDHFGDVACLDHAEFDVLLRFNNLQQRLDGKAHRSLLVHAISILVLKELAELFRLLSNGAGLPLTNCT